jgi:hypothetical protein
MSLISSLFKLKLQSVYVLRRPSVDAASTTVLRYEPSKDIIVGYILAPPDTQLESA